MSVPKFLKNRGVSVLLLSGIGVEGGLIAESQARGKQIWINKDLLPVGKLTTLLHELIHLIEPDFSEDEVMADESIILSFLGIPADDTIERRLSAPPQDNKE